MSDGMIMSAWGAETSDAVNSNDGEGLGEGLAGTNESEESERRSLRYFGMDGLSFK